MLTLNDLKGLLAQNETLLREELSKGLLNFDTRRVFDLSLHRSIVKDMIIEALESELKDRRNVETRPFQSKVETQKKTA